MRRPTAFVLWLAHLSRADEPPSHTYLGCYVDKTKKRDLEERVDGTIVNDISAVSNGPRWCAEVCHSLGFPYFGLQTLICFCGSAYGSYGAAKDSACRHACPDLSGVMCGGHLLNSVYAINPDAIVLDQGTDAADAQAQLDELEALQQNLEALELELEGAMADDPHHQALRKHAERNLIQLPKREYVPPELVDAAREAGGDALAGQRAARELRAERRAQRDATIAALRTQWIKAAAGIEKPPPPAPRPRAPRHASALAGFRRTITEAPDEERDAIEDVPDAANGGDAEARECTAAQYERDMRFLASAVAAARAVQVAAAHDEAEAAKRALEERTARFASLKAREDAQQAALLADERARAAHKEADSSTPDASARHATDDAAPPRAMSAAERHFEREKAARKERETRRREKLMTREAERQQREERQRASGGRSQRSSTPEGSRTPQPGIYS